MGAVVWAVIFAACTEPARAAKLLPHTLRAWGQYLPWADAAVERELTGRGFLIEDYLPAQEQAEIRAQIHRGRVVVRKRTGIVPAGVKFSIPDGSIHHWWGVIFAPDIGLDRMMALVKDYDHHAGRFEEVERSRLLERDGDTFRFYMRLRRTKAPITVYYNTEHVSRYISRAPDRVSTRSEATKIAELGHPGTPRERELSDQEDWGFLWRAVTWWRFVEVDNGVIVECESATLGRGIPGWLRLLPGLMRYIDSVPRETITNTLINIRTAAATIR